MALAETAVVVLSLFAAPFFPLGDVRWFLIGIGSIAIFAIWVYIDYLFERRKEEKRRAKLKLESQFNKLEDGIDDSLNQIRRILVVNIAQTLDVLNERFQLLNQKLDDLLTRLKPPGPDK